MTDVFHIAPVTARAAVMWAPLLAILLVVLLGVGVLVGVSALPQFRAPTR
jgi:hypothetical protein